MNNELTHWGIKGQKWGRRRFQYEDGTLTPAGKLRYDDDPTNDNHALNEASKATTKKQKEYKIPETKSKHRLNLEEKYKNNGMSVKDAEQAAARRIRAEQYTVAAAAITVTACIAYNKYKGYSTDKTLDSNMEFQRIMKLTPNAEIREGRQYMAYKPTDKIKYKGTLAEQLKSQAGYGEKIYDVTVKPQQDIKIASPKRAKDTFVDLYKKDADFRNSLEKMAKDNGKAPFNPKFYDVINKLTKGETISDKELRSKGYDLFNFALVEDSDNGRSRADKFFKALKDQGVNAMYDINDQKYSGYKSKAPIITFDGKYSYTKREMVDEEIKKNAAKSVALVLAPDVVKGGAGFTAIYGAMKWADNKAVENYKKEHPNTELTDKEILKMLQTQY